MARSWPALEIPANAQIEEAVSEHDVVNTMVFPSGCVPQVAIDSPLMNANGAIAATDRRYRVARQAASAPVATPGVAGESAG